MINCNFIAASKMAGWAFFFLPSKGGSIYNESLTSLSVLTFLKLIFFIFVRKYGIENLLRAREKKAATYLICFGWQNGEREPLTMRDKLLSATNLQEVVENHDHFCHDGSCHYFQSQCLFSISTYRLYIFHIREEVGAWKTQPSRSILRVQ